MIEIQDIAAYGITRDDILANAKNLAGPPSKEVLAWSAFILYTNKVLAQVRAAFADIREVYEVTTCPRDDAADPTEWDGGLISALAAELPAVYRRHVQEPDQVEPDAEANPTSFDLDQSAAAIAYWAAQSLSHSYVDKYGKMLAKLGVTAGDYAEPVSPEDKAEQDRLATLVSGATRDDVIRAWQQFGQALDCDQGELAKALGMSRSTVANYAVGRTPAKCSAEQAVVMAAECRSRALLLAAAAEVFERVK